ncbi:MAG: hypothetical protein KKD01_18010 [Proteobacteria bacterium]|nr:hypothetical protein [Pseudomonadota bacterium]
MKDQSEQKPSKVTKVLVDKIHGGRKQDSKFWQSEFSETKREPIQQGHTKRGSFIESFVFFVVFFVGIGIVAYGGSYLYKRYYTEFANPIQPIKQTTANSTSERRPVKKPAATIDDKPITQKELDRAIQKALADKSKTITKNAPPQATNFYYKVELVNGGKIEAESATREGDLLTIKDRKGLVFSVNLNEIKNVKKIKI